MGRNLAKVYCSKAKHGNEISVKANMSAAEFINIILTPLAYGAAAFLLLSWGAKKHPEKFAVVSRLSIRVFLGVTLAIASFIQRVALDFPPS
jgi:hypothetical protein